MVTSADRSLVLTEEPTQPGSIIGNSHVGFGATLYRVAVLGPEIDPKTNSLAGYAWSRTGIGSPAEPGDIASSLLDHDWLLIGQIPTPSECEASRLTELPTEPGSVIARAVDFHGITFYQTAVLDWRDSETDDPNYHGWRIDGEDSWPELEDMQQIIEAGNWVYIGVVPPGDDTKTPAQQARWDEYQREWEKRKHIKYTKEERKQGQREWEDMMEREYAREEQRQKLGIFA